MVSRLVSGMEALEKSIEDDGIVRFVMNLN
jgi:hypothetical protein